MKILISLLVLPFAIVFSIIAMIIGIFASDNKETLDEMLAREYK